MDKKKKRLGDRRDGELLRDLDSMHFIVPLIYPNRCDNEAYISEKIDLTNINAWLAAKNEAPLEDPYTMFQVIVSATLKTLMLRPKMNRFIANKNIYQRNFLRASFIVKKKFNDESTEALAFVDAKENDTIDTVRQKIQSQIKDARSEGKVDRSTDSMDILNKMPRFFSKFLVWIITKLDKHGKCPQFLIGSDPYYSSVILTNLGSIKLKCGYHHLTNWGTNSVFVVIGEKKPVNILNDDGSITKHEMLEIGLTIDERIADGYYYSKTIRLLKHLLTNPELLTKPFSETLEY